MKKSPKTSNNIIQIQFIDSEQLADILGISHQALLKKLAVCQTSEAAASAQENGDNARAVSSASGYDETVPLRVAVESNWSQTNLGSPAQRMQWVQKQIAAYESEQGQLAQLSPVALHRIAQNLRDLWYEATALKMPESEIERINKIGKLAVSFAKAKEASQGSKASQARQKGGETV